MWQWRWWLMAHSNLRQASGWVLRRLHGFAEGQPLAFLVRDHLGKPVLVKEVGWFSWFSDGSSPWQQWDGPCVKTSTLPSPPSCKPSTWSGSSTVKPTSAFPLHIYQAQEILAVWAQHKQTHQDNHWSWLGCALRKTLVNQKETKKRNETWSRIKRSYWQML